MSNKTSEKIQKPAAKNLAPKDATKVKGGNRKAGGDQHDWW